MNRSAIAVLVLFFFSVAATTALSKETASKLPELQAGQSLGIALGISSMPNLRDTGGYRTGSGANVVRERIYRSDTFNPLSSQDIKRLEPMALKNDYDLRTDEEMKAKPDQLPPGVHHFLLNVLADEKPSDPSEMNALLADPKKANEVLGGGKIEAEFMKGYRRFVSLPSAKQAYKTLFLALANSANLPAVFHCSAGKDRTGWATAALLSLLGVPQETVMADYLRTNEYVLPQYRQKIENFVAGGGERSIPLAIYGVKPEYLNASFDEMKKQYGTIENYFSEGLGIDASVQQTLRERLLTNTQ